MATRVKRMQKGEMMRPDISEFSFGFALTDEIINGTTFPLSAAPFFPSLIQEGRSGGYDVRLDRPGMPLFLQFKLSDCMVSRGAKEIKDLRLFSDPPFYRMKLRPSRYSRQHQIASSR